MEAMPNYHGLVRQDAMDFIPGRVGRLLDFGGGVGATAAALRAAGRADHAVLLDQVADKALPGVDVAIPIDLEDAKAVTACLALHGPFDTILCLDILEHLRDPWKVVATLECMLVPGGRLVVSLPNVCNTDVIGPLVLHNRFDYIESGIRDRTHLRWFTRETAIALATGSGLQLEEARGMLWARSARVLNRLTLSVFERFLAKQYLVRVRKSA